MVLVEGNSVDGRGSDDGHCGGSGGLSGVDRYG